MNPEDLIFAFLQIWENNPDDILTKSGAINNLQQLSDNLVDSQDQSDSEILKVLQTWCHKYPLLGQKVIAMSGEKKLDADANIPPPDPAHQIIINQYPKIGQILRNRPPKITEKNKQ